MVTYKEYSEKWEKQLMSKEKLTDIWKKKNNGQKHFK